MRAKGRGDFFLVWFSLALPLLRKGRGKCICNYRLAEWEQGERWFVWCQALFCPSLSPWSGAEVLRESCRGKIYEERDADANALATFDICVFLASQRDNEMESNLTLPCFHLLGCIFDSPHHCQVSFRIGIRAFVYAVRQWAMFLPHCYTS